MKRRAFLAGLGLVPAMPLATIAKPPAPPSLDGLTFQKILMQSLDEIVSVQSVRDHLIVATKHDIYISNAAYNWDIYSQQWRKL